MSDKKKKEFRTTEIIVDSGICNNCQGVLVSAKPYAFVNPKGVKQWECVKCYMRFTIIE